MLLQERPVDQLDMDAAVLHGLDGVGDLYQLARGGSSHPLALHLKKFGEVSLIRGEFDPGCLEPFHAVGAIVSLALGFDLPHREDGIDAPDPDRVSPGMILNADRTGLDVAVVGFQDDAVIVWLPDLA
jgi:hypothetical protein